MSYPSDFDGIENATLPAKRAPFLTAGEWVLRVERMERIVSQQKRGVRYWLVTFLVQQGPAGQGEERAWIMKLEDPALYLREIKSFVTAMLADDSVSITAALIEQLIGPEQPATGNLVRCKATLRESSKTGNPWTKLEWSPFDAIGNGATKVAIDEDDDTPF